MASITKKPSSAPSSLTAPARQSGGRIMKSTWKVPNRLTAASYNDRATSLPYEWIIGLKTGTTASSWTIGGTAGTSDTSRQINLDNITSKGATRNSFYPKTSRKLTKVSFRIRGKNAKGSGAWVTSSRAFKAPRKPVISAPTRSEETGSVSVTIETNAGEDYQERYDTRYQIVVYDSRTGTTTTTVDSSSTSTEITATYDPEQGFALLPGEYLKVTFKAWARGYAGDSATVTRTHIIGYPATPTITGTRVSSSVDGKVVVNLNTNDSETSPVDRVTLEALVSTNAATEAAAVAEIDDWDELDITDNAKCTALVANIRDIMPDTGKKTWLRVKAWHDFKSTYYVTSAPVRITELEREQATVQDNRCEIVGATPSGDTAIVTIGWDATGGDSMDGTEVSWATSDSAWRSTEQPDTFKIPNSWNEGAVGSWLKSATLYIKDLDTGSPVFIRARRYDGDTFGAYSPTVQLVPAGVPAAVVLSAPGTVIRGEAVQFAWSFSSPMLQKAWRLMTTGGVVIDEGTDGYTSQVVSWERIEEVANEATEVVPLSGSGELEMTLEHGDTFTVNSILPAWTHVFDADTEATVTEGGYGGDSATLEYDGEGTLEYDVPDGFSIQVSYPASGDQMGVYVSVSTGGDWVDSQAVTVRLADYPTLTLTVDGTLEAQPLSFTAATSANIAALAVRVVAQGSEGEYPEGMRTQPAGDTVYSAILSPAWVSGSATIELPPGLDFYSGAGYTVEAVLTDGETGLSTETVTESFTVEWEHEAPVPSEDITIVGSATADTEKATITLAAPEDAAETDVYDIYRISQGKPVLVCSDVPLDEVIEDTYAPYGDGTRYRIATRTADGSVEWADYEYTLAGNYVRLDWDGQYFEYPYQMHAHSGFAKDFEARRKANGANAGYWNQGATRTASFNSDSVAVDHSQIEAVLALAEYPGAVFVRTPDGAAFAADVQVSLDSMTAVQLISVSFEAHEVELPQEFTIQLEEEEPDDDES